MLENYIKAAKKSIKADLVLKGGYFVDVFSGDVKKGDVALVGDTIVGTGEYEGISEIDCSNKFVLPGYIDGHVHIESSQLTPAGFCSLVTPRGTTAVVADPHEIANVCGIKGCEYLKNASKNLPLDVFLNLPSCVPATPFETSGAAISAEETKKNISRDIFFGLGEFMNFPAVTAGDRGALQKINAAHKFNKPVDGHAPALSGYDLNAYISAGIFTDHECMTCAEAEEKVSKGMYVLLRHGSTARDLRIAAAMTDKNFRRFALCTDDRHAADLMQKGHIDDALRTLVKEGADPVRAVTLATLNVAECYRLPRRGAVAPYYLADLAVVDDLENFNAKIVLKGGKVVAKDGKLVEKLPPFPAPDFVKNTVKFKDISEDSFKIRINCGRVKAIKMLPGEAATDKQIIEVGIKDGCAVLPEGVLKLAVIERHKMTGNIGLGFLTGYGFSGGAIGLSIAHDSHNLIVVGDDDMSMKEVADSLKRSGGGMALAKKGEKALCVPLEIAGLMSEEPAEVFVEKSQRLIAEAQNMGVKGGVDPFLGLAFLSLGVIPKLKLLDTGLFDVDKFDFTPIEER